MHPAGASGNKRQCWCFQIAAKVVEQTLGMGSSAVLFAFVAVFIVGVKAESDFVIPGMFSRHKQRSVCVRNIIDTKCRTLGTPGWGCGPPPI